MYKLILLILLSAYIFSAKVDTHIWKKGTTFKEYLKRHKISNDIINSLDEDNKKLISEITNNREFYELIATNGVLLQTLIPIGEELQLHLFRTPKGYELEIIPIEYKKDTYIAIIYIEKNPYRDIIKRVKNVRVAKEFTRLLKHSIDFKNIKKGDRLAIVYDQKMRLGKPIGVPDIKVAMIDTNNTKYYVFKYSDGKYYNKNGEELIKRYMGKPLKHIRVTSKFTFSRYHPILHKYRAHLGVDFGAKRGTPIFAVADGKVIFSGEIKGYGKVIKIEHKDGYVTLYAHQSRLKAKVDDIVKKGDIIGFVGSTGISTAPHLHFGVYKDGFPIDPMLNLVEFSPKELKGEDRDIFLIREERYIKIINKIFDKNISSFIWNIVNKRKVSPKMKNYYKKQGW